MKTINIRVDEPRKPTTATPYIFILGENKPETDKVKMRLPSSIDFLKKKAKESLNIDSNVVYCYNIYGEHVNFIEDVKPGETIIVTNKGPSDSINIKTFSGRNDDDTFDIGVENGWDGEEISNISTGMRRNDKNQKRLASRNSGEDSGSRRKVYKSKPRGKEVSFVSRKSEITSSAMKSGIDTSVSKVLKERTDDNVSLEANLESLINSNVLSKEFYDKSLEEEEDDDTGEYMYTTEDASRSHNVESIFTMSSLYPEVNALLTQKLNDNPKMLGIYVKEIKKEKKYANKCFNYLLKQFLPPVRNKKQLTMQDEIQEMIKKILNKHRIIFPYGISYSFKTIIDGPKESGKSTILTLLFEQFYSDMCTARVEKRNFVFAINGQELMSHFTNIREFTKYYINSIFECIVMQRTGLSKHLRTLVSYMQSCAGSENINQPPPNFVKDEFFRTCSVALYQVALSIAFYPDEDDIQDYVNKIVLLPVAIAEAFGFSRTHVFIDNFDLVDKKLETEYGQVKILDSFNCLFNRTSFVAATKFNNCIENITDFDVVSTLGCHSSFFGDDKEFNVKFDGESKAIKITPKICCGCPAYIAMWENMCYEMDNDGDQEEVAANLIDNMHNLLSTIYDQGLLIKRIKQINPITIVL